MSKGAMVQARVELRLKKQVDKILDNLGLTKSQLINLLYKQIKLHNGIPFEIKIPNKETKEALKEAKTYKKSLKEYKSHDDIITELGL